MPHIIEIEGKWNKDTKRLADLILENIAGKSILDLGCHSGFFLQEATLRGASVAVGIDFDPEIVKIAQEINSIMGHSVDISDQNIDSYSPSRSYDIILLLSVVGDLKNPTETVDKYVQYGDALYIEHDIEHASLFNHHDIAWTQPSFRSSGKKFLSLIKSRKV